MISTFVYFFPEAYVVQLIPQMSPETSQGQ